jgi:hypothetical protein
MANEITIQIARDVRSTLAGNALTERQAKLYSQRLRLDMGSDGLASFALGDVDSYIDEAMLLIQCGLLERAHDEGSAWRNSVKRAAEILEWSSQSSLKPSGAPLHLLSASAYQVAGFPAMALGQLRRVPTEEPISQILRELLRANFPATLEAIQHFWRNQRGLEYANRIDPADLTTLTFQNVVMCIGTVCTYLKSGHNDNTQRALTKLDNLASSFVYSRDSYSYLLAQMTAASCRRFVETSFWPQVERLSEDSSDASGAAFVQFARSAFNNSRALVWPAQAEGIGRLVQKNSFVLCTPTGSGKTTVATLAIIQSLFTDLPENQINLATLEPGSLVLYLVPSRALAAEVESRLSQDLSGITANPVVVTGLYGGIDWGPTDAWIDSGSSTIVICTFEKADALIRYLGVLFLNRVCLVIIDEAHMVEQDITRVAALKDGSSRAFRLEQLGSRLLRAHDEHDFRIVALSAVAARAAPALARWISGSPNDVATTSSYRSTRQMIGRIEVSSTGRFEIRYDLMDGRSLKFDDERRADTPYVRNPFPSVLGGMADAGPEVKMRAPTLWAALHLAAERPDGARPSVLISITQSIEAFSSTCADLMDNWPGNALPNYGLVDETDDSWIRCLASAADYFTEQSVEYRLLRKGIAVHHGKMPNLLARRLKVLIDRSQVRVIIATSTLSEGVNIPINFLLIPSLIRGTTPFGLQEFSNLVGRAGRPGVSTEGSALVVLPERTYVRQRSGVRPAWDRQWNAYEQLVRQVEANSLITETRSSEDIASSPLSHLIRALEVAWTEISGGADRIEFTSWLEQTAVIGSPANSPDAFSYLDSLDAFLIASIQEIEELRSVELTASELEDELISIWRRTYAFACSYEEARLFEIWMIRGRVIKTQYPDAMQRRRIYKTSLPPKSAASLLLLTDFIRVKLQTGNDYARWPTEDRLRYITEVMSMLSQITSFKISTDLGRTRGFTDWPKLLRWWLCKNTLIPHPAPKHITNWFAFVSKNFVYRGAWGLGSVIGLLLDSADGSDPVRALEMDDWPRSGLPWIAFWMKELITWGTLDPVAAFLLARGNAIDRTRAEAEAQTYYENLPEHIDSNEILDPRTIREWIAGRRQVPEERTPIIEITMRVDLERPAEQYLRTALTVTPLSIEDRIIWIDSAGHVVATSPIDIDLPEDFLSFEFELNVATSIIRGSPYLQHA